MEGLGSSFKRPNTWGLGFLPEFLFSSFFFCFLVGDHLASPLSRKKLHSLNIFIGFILLFVRFLII